MIRITITPAAYAAIAATLALGTVAVEPERARNGDISIRASRASSTNRQAALSFSPRLASSSTR
jgi:hypothetical protein